MGERSERVDTPNYARRLWWEGLRCGLLSLTGSFDGTRLRHAARLCLCPVDLWRYGEFQAVLEEYEGEGPVLDVGSPKLLALVLARWFGATVLASDIAKRIGPEVAVYARAAGGRGRLAPGVFDAVDVPLADSSVSFIYSVSAIEHIGGDGDSRAAAEFARVLRPGGKAVITAPMGAEFQEIWVERDSYGHQKRDSEGRVFFCYVYDWEALDARIIKPSGLRLTSVQLLVENAPGWYENVYAPRVMSPTSGRSILMKLLDPYWAHVRLNVQKVGEERSRIAGRAVAVVTLVKNVT